MRAGKGSTPSRIASVVLAASIAGYAIVSPVSVILEVENRPISVGFRVVLLIASMWVASQALFGGTRGFPGRVWVPLFFFWSIYLARLVADLLIAPIGTLMSSYEYLSLCISSTVAPMVAILFAPSESLRRSRWLIWVLLVVASVTNLLLGFGPGAEVVELTGRLQSPTLNPISLGHVGASLAILVASRLMVRDRYSSRRVGLAEGGSLLVGLLVMSASNSRGPIVAFLVALGFMSMSTGRGSSVARIGGISIALLGTLSLVVFYLDEHLHFQVFSRLHSLLDPETDVTGSDRLALIGQAWNQFLEFPLFGSAFVELESRSYPHNLLVESFMATGLAGGALFGFLLASAVVQSIHLVRRVPEAKWIGLLCVQYTAGAMFSGSLYSSTAMWCLWAAVFNVVGERDRRVARKSDDGRSAPARPRQLQPVPVRQWA